MEIHLTNGWCKHMNEAKGKAAAASSAADLPPIGQPYLRSAKLFKLLTGRELSSVINNNNQLGNSKKHAEAKKKKDKAGFSFRNLPQKCNFQGTPDASGPKAN